jgi:hypothetical protein
MRAAFLAVAMLGFVSVDISPALAQSRDEITGTTCRQLYRSCMRICVRHFGEPAYRGCQADCNNGNKSCRATLTWRSKDVTITATRRK